MRLVCSLAEFGQGDGALAGGKGANLGELLQAGLPVPPGFVVTTAAYRHFVAANSLQLEIERLAQAAPPDDMTALTGAANAIGALFATAIMPPETATAIREAYVTLRELPVAVRSSATAEDLPGASFAGQMDTYLNIRGAEALLEAVRRCWASLWTARAISYRAKQGIAPGAVSLAVVVQELLAADAAGVLFTANPVNGRRDQMVIDGCWGLGEALVSGQVTPDHWVVNARIGAVLEARIARKEVMTTRQETGTVTLPVPASLQEKPVLDEAQVAALTDLGRRVAAHYGAPQDIEWALAHGRLYLVQARPITSLFPLPQPEPAVSAGERVCVCVNTLQGLVEPFTPMGIAAFRAFGRGVAGLVGVRVRRGEAPPPFKVAAGRVYLDITPVLRNRTTRAVVLRGSGAIDRQISAILRFLVERDRDLVARSGHFPFRPPVGFLLRKLGQLFWAALFPDAARAGLLARTEARVAALEKRADALRGLAERQRFIEGMLPRLGPDYFSHFLPLVGCAWLAVSLVRAKLQVWLGDDTALQPVLRALPHNPTTEMDLALWGVAQRLKKEGVAPSAGHPAVQVFLARYGHRAAREIDLGVSRWSEDPTPILNILRTYLTHGEEADPARHFRRGAELADETVADLIERVRREKGRLRAAWLRFLLRRVRALAGLREYPKFYAVRILAAVRRTLAGAGAELVAAGRLDRAEDVFFLDLRDVQTPHDLRAVAAANRADYERERSRRAIPRVLTSTGETFYSAPTVTPGALIGTAASAGVYEGRVRVVFDPREAKLEPGEVLVAPGTDPAWTPLFLSAGALVMEIGGMMSHGSVVAREYGIPAVVGVAGATQQLQTGQRVRVDGENGLVVPL
jgi:phosphohistidine swiveling domain-containing protein